MHGYSDNYYTRTASDTTERPTLSGTVDADVCIIGGGLAGLSTALDLTRAGKSVVLLEAKRAAFGASGRNGGFVGNGYATSGNHIALMVGKDKAKTLLAMAMEGRTIVENNIKALGMADIAATYGKISALRAPDAASLIAYRDKMQADFGYELTFLPRDEVRALLNSPKYYEGLYDPLSFHFHPLNYARGLARAIEAGGGRIYELSPALSAEIDGAEKRVRTEHGSVKAQHLVFAGGGYTDKILPALRKAMLPISTYVLLTEPAPDRIMECIKTTAAVSDQRRAGDYYRLVDGGKRILWGGRITTRISEPQNLAALMKQTMVSTYPGLADVKVDVAWSGLMSYARHLMPLIGEYRPGVWHVLGFGGHGLNTTAIGGRVIAEGITGASDRYRLYGPFGLGWNGGPFGTMAAQLTYWAYQAMDYWKERKASQA